jgi:hypothetical protein
MAEAVLDCHNTCTVKWSYVLAELSGTYVLPVAAGPVAVSIGEDDGVCARSGDVRARVVSRVPDRAVRHHRRCLRG